MENIQDRLVLFEKAGSGVIDEFVDRLSLTGADGTGFTVETTIEGDCYDYRSNALGEILVKRCENVFGPEQLREAIKKVTDDEYDRWENIDWSWNEILANLRRRFPKLANELAEIVKKEDD